MCNILKYCVSGSCTVVFKVVHCIFAFIVFTNEDIMSMMIDLIIHCVFIAENIPICSNFQR